MLIFRRGVDILVAPLPCHYNEIRKQNEQPKEVLSMRILKKILLLPVKLLVLPLILLLKIIYTLAYLVTHIGTYILSPLILFVLGCGIWCATQGRWADVGLLTGIEVMIIAVIFAAVWLLDAVQTVSTGLASILHA